MDTYFTMKKTYQYWTITLLWRNGSILDTYLTLITLVKQINMDTYSTLEKWIFFLILQMQWFYNFETLKPSEPPKLNYWKGPLDNIVSLCRYHVAVPSMRLVASPSSNGSRVHIQMFSFFCSGTVSFNSLYIQILNILQLVFCK